MRPVALVLLVSLPLASACVENEHPGNDREASLEPAAPAAEVATAEAALAGVATAILHPQIMTDADLRNAPGPRDRCAFRFTRVGFPAFVYDSTAGVIKLNGRLVPLPALGGGVYEDGAARVTVRPLDEQDGDGTFEAELVLRFEDAPHELGYHGFSGCGDRST